MPISIDEYDQELKRIHAVLNTIGDIGYAYILEFGTKNFASKKFYNQMPENWFNTYVGERYFADDEVLIWAQHGHGFVRWDDFQVLNDTQEYRNVRRMAVENGLKYGSAYVSECFGDRHAVSLAHSRASLSFSEIEMLGACLFNLAYLDSLKETPNCPGDVSHRDRLVLNRLRVGDDLDQIAKPWNSPIERLAASATALCKI